MSEYKPFEPRKKRKHIGKYGPRIDGWEKARGEAKYIDDITTKKEFPDMLYAKILKCPYPHAKIVKLDTIKAEQLLGVHTIMTFEDEETIGLKMTNQGWSPGNFLISYEKMFFPHLRDRKVFQDVGRWVGDKMGVLICAESEEIAEEALKLVDVEWEKMPFVLDRFKAMEDGAPILHPEIDPSSNVRPTPPPDWNLPGGANRVMYDKGDIEKGLKEADAVIDVAVEYGRSIGGTLDNWCCVADWDKDGKLTIWSNSFSVQCSRIHLSEMLDMPMNKIRVISPYLGGSFGRCDTGEQIFFIFTALIAKKAGRPVKYRHTRHEEFLDTNTSTTSFAKVGAMKDGTITTMDLNIVGDGGAYADHSEGSVRLVSGEWMEFSLHHIPNLRAESRSVYTNTIPGSVKRGIGNLQVNWFMGRIVDEVASVLGLDPIDVWVNNIQFGHMELPNKNLEVVLRKGAESIGWERRNKIPGKGELIDGYKRRGIGFGAIHSWKTSSVAAMIGEIQIEIRINPDGTIILVAPTVETGPGGQSSAVFACADSLGVKPEHITLMSKERIDTEIHIKDVAQTGSCIGHIIPEAIHPAALEAKRRILARATEILGASVEELDMVDGIIFEKSNPDNKVEMSKVFEKQFIWTQDIVRHNHMLPPRDTGAPYLASFIEVEVDTETGEFKILDFVQVNDLGTVMYPTAVESQMIGGQAMGIGEAAYEEIIYDEKTGIPLNFNFIDYKIPCMADTFDVTPIMMEYWLGDGEYGACGLGESVLACTPRGLENAIYNAIGVRIDDSPITPTKILKALGKI